MTLTRQQHVLINFVAFQCAWFATVLGAARNQLALGLGITVLIVLLHLWLAHRPLRELQLLVCVLLLGGAWDSALAANGVIAYQDRWLPALAPFWILVMWAQFATTLNVALGFLRRRYALAALFGAVGAPLSFLAGQSLGALQFPDQPLALRVLAAGWALLMPLLLWLAERFNGVATEQTS